MTNNILDVFTYETVEIIKNVKYFKNCIFLKDTDDFRKGDKVDCISITLGLYVWDENDVFIGDETISI